MRSQETPHSDVVLNLVFSDHKIGSVSACMELVFITKDFNHLILIRQMNNHIEHGT